MPTRAQTTKVFTAAKEIGWDREQIYDLVEQVSGGRSVSALTMDQASAVIDAMVRAGARAGTPKKKPRGRRTAENETLMVTRQQIDLMLDYRERLGGRWLEERYFEGACVRLIRRPRPINAGQGARVIEMLKRRLAHQEAKRG